jgi:5-guanidino-2-oxopentanoate decarboxylase
MKKPLGVQISHALKKQGVEVIFGIPGVHNVELYRGIEEAGLKHILTRHEQGAGFMADGYSRATGKPGVAFVITGPGLCNIMTPMGQAYSDSIPMLVISSCLNPGDLTTEGGRLHEMRDQEAAAGTVCDWSKTALDSNNAYQLLDRAFFEFISARPRPKHIQVPISVLGELAKPSLNPIKINRNNLDQPHLHEKIANELELARRVIVIVGGGCVNASSELRFLIEKTGAASFSTYAGRGVINDDNKLYFGATLARADSLHDFAKADLVLAIGTTLSEVDLWRNELGHNCNLIRIDIDPSQLCDQHKSDLTIMADAKTFIAGINSKLKGDTINSDWDEKYIKNRRAAFRKQADSDRPGIVPLVDALHEVLNEDTLIYSDMTQFAYVAKEIYPMTKPSKWHHPFGFGTLGYALPAAIGGKIGDQNQSVVAIMGDYGFHYTMQELGVAVEHKLGIPIIIWDNEKLKEIEDSMIESQIAPNAVIAKNPNFCKLAEAFGAHSSRPNSIEEFKSVVELALSADLPTVIHLTSDLTMA